MNKHYIALSIAIALFLNLGVLAYLGHAKLALAEQRYELSKVMCLVP